MNNDKICFITCVNDERLYEECLVYINSLDIPKNFSIETVALEEPILLPLLIIKL